MKAHQSVLTKTIVFAMALSGSTFALEPVNKLPKSALPTSLIPAAGIPSGPPTASDACPAANVGTLASGGGSIVGSTIGATDSFDASANGCGDNTGGKDQIFEFDVDGAGVWAFDTCTVPACWDTTLSLREDTGGGCPGDQVACDGDGCNVCNFESGLATFLTTGTTYYLIVDGWSTYTYGDFEVTYLNVIPACSDDASCDDGIFCNGSETCDVASGACNPGAAACLLHETCDEAGQTCPQPDPCTTWAADIVGSGFFFPQANLCPDTATWVFDDIQTSKHATGILDFYTTPVLARSTPAGAGTLGAVFLVSQALWDVEELSCNPLAIIGGSTCTGVGTVDPGGSPAHDLPCSGTMPALPNNDGDFNRCEIDFFISFKTSENGAGMAIAGGQQTIGGPGARDEFGVDVIWVEDCPPTGAFSPTFFGDDENLPADFGEAVVCEKLEVQCCNPDGSCSLGTQADCDASGGTGICTSTIANGGCECEGDGDGDGIDCDCGDNCCDDANPGQEDCDGDGEGDACAKADCIVCCIDGETKCPALTEEKCTEKGGVPLLAGADCPLDGTIMVVDHSTPQRQWSHEIIAVVVCSPPDATPEESCCPQGDTRIDPWKTASGGRSCQDFGNPASPQIPADFFGPGSDSFLDEVCFEGVPLGVTPDGEFGPADTLVKRTEDPFRRCDPVSTTTVSTVGIEIVGLSLASVAPITVTFNGGQDPEQWDVAITLSDQAQPIGTLSATKTHCNGGTFDSELPVKPRFTFSRAGTALVLEAGILVTLTASDVPWIQEFNSGLESGNPICSDFHAGVDDTDPTSDCSSCPDGDSDGVPNDCDNCPDLQTNNLADGDGDGVGDACDKCPGFDDNLDEDGDGVPDECDVCPDSDDNAPGATLDDDGDGVANCVEECPGVDDAVFAPECEGAIPTVSEWGLVILALLLLAAGKVYFNGRRRAPV